MPSKKFMRLAIEKARLGMKSGQTPFGACIVRGDSVVAWAHNVVWKDTDITAHAEVTAIRQACKKLKTVKLSGCTIYSTCEPCPMCFAACHWAGIRHIVFGTGIADARMIGFKELSISNAHMKQKGRSRMKVTGGFMRRESLELFREFLKIKNRKIY